MKFVLSSRLLLLLVGTQLVFTGGAEIHRHLRNGSTSGNDQRKLVHHGGGHPPPHTPMHQLAPGPDPRPAPGPNFQHGFPTTNYEHGQQTHYNPQPDQYHDPEPDRYHDPEPDRYHDPEPDRYHDPQPDPYHDRQPDPYDDSHPDPYHKAPSDRPTPYPTRRPTDRPTPYPTPRPTMRPTDSPSHYPSENPSNSEEPSENPTQSDEPSENPTQSEEPSENPTFSAEPSDRPSVSLEPSVRITTRTLAGIICAMENAATFSILCTAIQASTPVFLLLNDDLPFIQFRTDAEIGIPPRLAKVPEHLANKHGERKLMTNSKYTMFAPDNLAFEKFLNTPLKTLFGTSSDTVAYFHTLGFDITSDTTRAKDFFLVDSGTQFLSRLLLSHIIGGERAFGSLTCNKTSRMLSGVDTITECHHSRNKAQVGTKNNMHNLPLIIDADVDATNGILHRVSNVIIPDFVFPTGMNMNAFDEIFGHPHAGPGTPP